MKYMKFVKKAADCWECMNNSEINISQTISKQEINNPEVNFKHHKTNRIKKGAI